MRTHVAGLLGASLLSANLPAGADAPSSRPPGAGIVAIWLNSPSLDREAILKMPVIKDGQAVVQWAQVEPEKGKYDFSALDEQLADNAKRHLPATVQLNGNLKPQYLFNEVPYVKETGKDVAAFRQVNNREGTLMFWHPAHEKAYVNCLTALRDHLASSPYKGDIIGLRMNFNPFGTEMTNIFPQDKAAEYARKERWIQPPGLDRSLPYNGFNKQEATDYVRRIMRKHVDLFSGVVPMFVRCTFDSDVTEEFAPYLENGTFGLFETGSLFAPFATKAENQQAWFLKYCKTGKTVGYAESFCNAWGWHSMMEELLLSPPQAFYWRVLCDLHKGVSYIACYGSDLNMALTGAYKVSARTVDGRSVNIDYSDSQSGFDYRGQFTEALQFGDRYAGWHASPASAPGAWIALRESDAVGNANNQREKLKVFTGDYTFLMERLPDHSTGVTKVGPDQIRYGGYARRLPAHESMRLKVDGRFLESLKGSCRLSVIYFDDAAGSPFAVSAGGQTWEAPMKGGAAWQTAGFDMAASAFKPAADGAQIVIQAADAPICLHMATIERK
ncbi:MAG: beta-galactosidase [Candidatus Sumerlaeota bacterium]|nr:beta-galactosidase [Candidatus Sumerlaeota bacterium]